MKTFVSAALSLSLLAACAGTGLADCHRAVAVGYGVAAPVYVKREVVAVAAPVTAPVVVDPQADGYAGGQCAGVGAAYGVPVTLGAAYPTYGVGAVFAGFQYGYGVHAYGVHNVQVVERVRVVDRVRVDDRRRAENPNRGGGVLGILKAAARTVRNVGKAVVGG